MVACEARCSGVERAVLVRHGATLSYRDGGLTAEGRAQLRAVGDRLRSDHRGRKRVLVFTSPSRRCRESASAIVQSLRPVQPGTRAPIVREELRPVGVLVHGRLLDLGALHLPPGPIAADVARFWALQREGGDPFQAWERGELESLEPVGWVSSRLAGFARELWARAADVLPIAVTHAENIRLLEVAWGVTSASKPGCGEARCYVRGLDGEVDKVVPCCLVGVGARE